MERQRHKTFPFVSKLSHSPISSQRDVKGKKKKLSNKLLANYSCRLVGISLIKLLGSHAEMNSQPPTDGVSWGDSRTMPSWVGELLLSVDK